MHSNKNGLWILFISLFYFFVCACQAHQQSQIQQVEIISRAPSATLEETKAPPTKPQPGCQKTGCSGHICAPFGQSITTICIWRDEYACYKSAVCEKQPDGQCGWTPTPSLKSCLDAAKAVKD